MKEQTMYGIDLKTKYMGGYHGVYLRAHVLLLTDISENFKRIVYAIIWVRSCLLCDITEFCLGCYVEKD